MGLLQYMKVLIVLVLIDVNIQRIDRHVLCDNKVLQQLTEATFLYALEKTLGGKNHQ